MLWRKWTGWLTAAAGAAALLVALVPFAFAELVMVAARLEVSMMPAPANPAQVRPLPGPAAGTVVDGYWRVEKIAPDTWAIGEPAADPDNYEYLLVGKRRALLIDSGATRTHDIRRAITGLPALSWAAMVLSGNTEGLNMVRAFLESARPPKGRRSL